MDIVMYANVYLRDLAFAECDTFIQFSKEASEGKLNFFKHLWVKAQLSNNIFEEGDFLPVYKKLQRGTDLIIIKLPRPTHTNDSLFIGMLANGDRRFYLLELQKDRSYSLGCWEQIFSKTSMPRHFLLKSNVKPERKDFYKLIYDIEM